MTTKTTAKANTGSRARRTISNDPATPRKPTATRVIQAKPETVIRSASEAAVIKASASDVAALAYQYFEAEGRPHGRDLEHWFRAEVALTARGAIS